jgi:hypothetical protein
MRKVVAVVAALGVAAIGIVVSGGLAGAGEAAVIEVTKEATGPHGGQDFTIQVTCDFAVNGEAAPQDAPPPLVTDLTLAAGETGQVVLDNEALCTITEPGIPAGCELVSIEPSAIEVTEPGVIESTVTNACAEPEPEAEPAAAGVVRAEPTFTG